jgi:hypothetical protein
MRSDHVPSHAASGLVNLNGRLSKCKDFFVSLKAAIVALMIPTVVIATLSAVSWFTITFNLLSPENLECAIEWRIFASRLLCILALLFWCRKYIEK